MQTNQQTLYKTLPKLYISRAGNSFKAYSEWSHPGHNSNPNVMNSVYLNQVHRIHSTKQDSRQAHDWHIQTLNN